MHRATSSSSSAASSSSSRSRLRISREQLERSLKVLGRPSDPLPVDLPPSPPVSRSSSPAPTYKRKHDTDAAPGPSKRPRANSTSETRLQAPSSSHRSGRHAHLRSDPPSEDGELREDFSAPRDLVVPSNVPVRRPRRGPAQSIPPVYFLRLYERFYASARALKYSGTARIYANNRPNTSLYRPLPHPPPPNSPYHKYANIMARLEVMESLIHFAYALWAKDMERKSINRGSWKNILPFHIHCKKKWIQDVADDRERALLGLIFMLDGFIQGTRIRENMHFLDRVTDEQLRKVEQQVAEKERMAKANTLENGAGSLATPPMLPSPASMTSSANSTPAGKRTDDSEPQPAEQAPPPPPPHQPAPHMPDPTVRIGLDWYDLRMRKSLTDSVIHSHDAMKAAQELLSLPILAKHYPRTFARVIHTTLSDKDEHEPDIEDEEGELYWPGQLIVSGVGWVCALGKAMIKEFGKEFGYRGIDGIVPKGDGDVTFENFEHHAQVPDPMCAPMGP